MRFLHSCVAYDKWLRYLSFVSSPITQHKRVCVTVSSLTAVAGVFLSRWVSACIAVDAFLHLLVLVHITFDSGMNGVNSRSVVITTPTTMPEWRRDNRVVVVVEGAASFFCPAAHMRIWVWTDWPPTSSSPTIPPRSRLSWPRASLTVVSLRRQMPLLSPYSTPPRRITPNAFYNQAPTIVRYFRLVVPIRSAAVPKKRNQNRNRLEQNRNNFLANKT